MTVSSSVVSFPGAPADKIRKAEKAAAVQARNSRCSDGRCTIRILWGTNASTAMFLKL